jgi:hypothetical protein
MRPGLSTAAILDQAVEVATRVARPWSFVLALGLMPLRLAQVELATAVIRLGDTAPAYRDYLRSLAWPAALGLVVAALARALFARAAALAQERTVVPGREVFRVPAFGLNYLWLSILLHLALLLSWYAVVTVPAVLILAGVAVGSLERVSRPGLIAPLREILRAAGPPHVLIALLLVFAVAHAVALVNLVAGFRLGLWLLAAYPGIDLTRWEGLLHLSNPRFVLLMIAGANLVVEPFWIAAQVTTARWVRARQTGEDLRLWFAELSQAGAR